VIEHRTPKLSASFYREDDREGHAHPPQGQVAGVVERISLKKLLAEALPPLSTS